MKTREWGRKKGEGHYHNTLFLLFIVPGVRPAGQIGQTADVLTVRVVVQAYAIATGVHCFSTANLSSKVARSTSEF